MADVRTRRWIDPILPGDGRRILVCRYRPRGVPKASESWDAWIRELAPSRELHAAVYGKHDQPAIDFEEYRGRYLVEMEAPAARAAIRALRERLAAGETLTLLCSSACENPARCHRTSLRELIVSTSPA